MYDPLGMRFFNAVDIYGGSSSSDWSNDSAGSSWNVEQDASKKTKKRASDLKISRRNILEYSKGAEIPSYWKFR